MAPTCPMCAEDVSAQDVVCPHCGNLLRTPPPHSFAAPPSHAPPQVAPPAPRASSPGVRYVVPLVLTLAAGASGGVWFVLNRRSAAPSRIDAADASSVSRTAPNQPQAAPARPTAAAPAEVAAADEATAIGPEDPAAQGEPASESAVALHPQTVTASSFISNRRNQHAPERAFDGDPTTAWNENERGPGDGAWIAATFASPVTVRRLRLSTGYDANSPRHGDLFVLNSHLRRVRVTFDGGRAIERDVAESQRQLVLGDLDIEARTIRIEALSVWPGSQWADLCISEVTVEGVAPR